MGTYGTGIYTQSVLVGLSSPGGMSLIDQRLRYEEIRTAQIDERVRRLEQRLRSLEQSVAIATAGGY